MIVYRLTARDSPQKKKIYMNLKWRNGKKKSVASKHTWKISKGSNTDITQNWFPKKGHEKRQRRSIHKIKRNIHQEGVTNININATNIGVLKYIRKILDNFKEYIDRNTPISKDFNTLLSKKNRSPKQRVNKDIVAEWHSRI